MVAKTKSGALGALLTNLFKIFDCLTHELQIANFFAYVVNMLP